MFARADAYVTNQRSWGYLGRGVKIFVSKAVVLHFW